MKEWFLIFANLYVLVAMFVYKEKYNEAKKYIEDLERENDDLRDDIQFLKGITQGIRDQRRRSSADHEAENAESREKDSDAKNN